MHFLLLEFPLLKGCYFIREYTKINIYNMLLVFSLIKKEETIKSICLFVIFNADYCLLMIRRVWRCKLKIGIWHEILFGVIMDLAAPRKHIKILRGVVIIKITLLRISCRIIIKYFSSYIILLSCNVWAPLEIKVI